ncbi:MAG: DUF3164 family protein [Clostridiaceae bacterium]|nr:DUF3164 family protein [Clostridiaceae bacterium]
MTKTKSVKKKQRRNVPAYLVDQNGERIPRKYVSDYDIERQMELESNVKEWLAERERLENLAEKTVQSAKYLEALRGTGMAERGNMQITSLDGLKQMEIVTAWRIELDDRATEAKHAMVEYAKKGLEEVKDPSAKQTLLAIIKDTFTPTRSGCLRNAMVVRLLNYNIKAKEWQDACALLRSAMQSIRGKTYLRINVRKSINDDWQMIRLDMNDCLPDLHTQET